MALSIRPVRESDATMILDVYRRAIDETAASPGPYDAHHVAIWRNAITTVWIVDRIERTILSLAEGADGASAGSPVSRHRPALCAA